MFNLFSTAADRFSGFAMGVCGALLISLAVQAVPTFGRSAETPADAVAQIVARRSLFTPRLPAPGPCADEPSVARI